MKQSFTLDPFQQQAIDYARRGYSVFVSAPTGAGKTVIAEHIITGCLEKGEGVIYTAPIKALSNQKFRNFSAQYPQKTGIVTGDVNIEPSAPLVIMTTEIFRNKILTGPEHLENRTWIIFDEIHYLDDIERGTVWEESLMLLPSHMHILALSATIPNISEIIQWIEQIHPFPIKLIYESQRPVPLHFFYQTDNKIFSNIRTLKASNLLKKSFKKSSADVQSFFSHTPNKLFSLITHIQQKQELPCIYFCFSRRRCEALAQEILSINFLTTDETNQITEYFSKLIYSFGIQNDPYCAYLIPFLKKGIAYHHAGLLPALKEIIERLFTTGLIKLIFTTETFALGINMPVKTCVFDTLSKYYGHYFRLLKTRDFYQMAGRAGRRGIDDEGFVYLRLNPNRISLSQLEKILFSEYEPINSQFNSCYATILNLFTLFQNNLIKIYPRSFHYWQSGTSVQRQARKSIERKLALLRNLHYITADNELSDKALLASTIYSFELQIGELFSSGYLESFRGDLLFVILCALVYEPRRRERKPRLNKQLKQIRRELDRITRNIHKAELQHKIYPRSKRFYFHLSEAAYAWYHGKDFYQLTALCGADEGEIVRYFRMAVQVLRELALSQVIPPPFAKTLSHCIQKVNRGVVDAEQQLKQEIEVA